MKTLALFFLAAAITLCVARHDGSSYPFLYREIDPNTAEPLATGYFLTTAAQTKGAVCLDGTPSAYYFRPGSGTGSKKWYIHHQGGGWCESVSDCYGRSLTDLGSSKNYPKQLDLGGGYFSTDPKENPQMYNWNSVFLRYCDGGSFSGDNATETDYQGHKLYFRGHRILEAMWEDLYTSRGLHDATDVVISGCSAGGLATFLHVDWWHDRLPKNAKVVGLPDSGFFLDYESAKHYHSGMMWCYNFFNASSGVNSACVTAHQKSGDAWKCFFAQHTAPFITTPIFPLQATYDSWQTANDLDSNNAATINQWGKNLTALVKATVLSKPRNGIFLDSCFHHCGEWNDIKIDGLTQPYAFENFYNDKGQKAFLQDKTYPCDSCCKP